MAPLRVFWPPLEARMVPQALPAAVTAPKHEKLVMSSVNLGPAKAALPLAGGKVSLR